MNRPVYLSHAGVWCAAGSRPEEIRQALGSRRTPTARLTVLDQEWPYAAAVDPAIPCLNRLEVGLEALAEDLDLDTFPKDAPLLLGSSSLLVGSIEGLGCPLGPMPPVEELESRIRKRWALNGPAWTFSSACVSAIHALDAAAGLIETGAVDEALVIGVELLNRTTLAGFSAMGLISSSACRPLDAERNGLLLGEAIAAVRLSARPGSWRLHAPALALDATSPTGHRPDGTTIAAVMGRALAHACLEPADIRAVKLQAAGALIADQVEVRALRMVFGDALPKLLTLKASLGHCLGASGLAEMSALLHCAEAGWLPPTAGFSDTDPNVGVAPITEAITYDGGPLLFNIQGFGGGIASWVVERP